MEAIATISDREVTRIVLVRHGSTTWNEERRLQGHQDPELSELGRQQARRLGGFLAGNGPVASGLGEIHAIYSSDLRRARQTAELVGDALGSVPVQLDANLREMNFGCWEGLTSEEISKRFPDQWRAWVETPLETRPGFGESLAELQERVLAALRGIAATHPGQTVLVVSHGGAIKAAICGILHLDLRERFRFSLTNCSVSVLTFRQSQEPRLDLLNLAI